MKTPFSRQDIHRPQRLVAEIPGRAPLPPQKEYFRRAGNMSVHKGMPRLLCYALYAYFGLMVVHIPLIPGPKDDFIGVFDFLCVAVILGIFFVDKRLRRETLKRSPFSAVAGAYSIFLAFIFLKEPLLAPSGTQLLDTYLIALLLKQVQYIFFFCVAFYAFVNFNSIIRNFHLIIMINLGIILGFGIYMLFFDRTWYRLGIPYKLGVSSNPAGVIISMSVIILVYRLSFSVRKLEGMERILHLSAILFGLVALYFTESRTNGILFHVFVVLMAVFTKGSSKSFVTVLVAAIFISLVLFNAYYSESALKQHARFRAPTTGYAGYILNPEKAYTYSSFKGRVNAWTGKFRRLGEHWTAVFVGRGLRAATSIDSMYVRMVSNHGIVGLFLFLRIYLSLLRFSRGLLSKLCVLYLLANAFTMDTMIVSWRTMQVAIPLVCYSLMVDVGPKRTVLSGASLAGTAGG